MKILYVHFKPAKTEAQIKAIADKVKLLKEVSNPIMSLTRLFLIFESPFSFCSYFMFIDLDRSATTRHP